MCAAFVENVDKRVWQAYPETGGFDLVMVHRKSGIQVGIEAKQTLNADVAKQAINHMRCGPQLGPDFHAILVPLGGNAALEEVLDLVGITTIRMRSGKHFMPQLPHDWDISSNSEFFWESRTWHQLCPEKRIVLPDYIPDSTAGSPSPVTLTDWKVRAIKIAILLERRGLVTTGDFDTLKISRSRWVQNGWISPIRRGVYKAGRLPNFRAQHPVNFDQIAADFEKWAAPLPTPPAELVEATHGG